MRQTSQQHRPLLRLRLSRRYAGTKPARGHPGLAVPTRSIVHNAGLSPATSLLCAVPKTLQALLKHLPELIGQPIDVCVKPCLTAYRGKLLSGSPECGTAVHAACFPRRRMIVLESELLSHPRSARLILIHELFHFVWIRLSNQTRHDFTELLRSELAKKAKGELGESSTVKKEALHSSDSVTNHARWRDYVCESFCDTAAWRYAGISPNAAFTLSERCKKARRLWWQNNFAAAVKC